MVGRSPLIWLNGDGEQPAESVARIVAVPPAGATIALFNVWRAPLRGNGIALGSVDWTEAEAGAPAKAESGVAARARMLAAAVAGVEPPWILLGHSFGGLIAYEAARLLVKRGAPLPRRLALCAVRPPHRPEPDVLLDGDDADITERLRQVGGPALRAAAHPVLRQLLLARVRADIAVSASYRHVHRSRLRCPSVVYAGIEDTVVPAELIASWPELLAETSVRFLPGGHFFIFDDPARFLGLLLADAGVTAGPSR